METPLVMLLVLLASSKGKQEKPVWFPGIFYHPCGCHMTKLALLVRGVPDIWVCSQAPLMKRLPTTFCPPPDSLTPAIVYKSSPNTLWLNSIHTISNRDSNYHELWGTSMLMYDVNAITVNMKVLPFREGSKNITHNCLAPSPTTEKIQDYLELKAITYASFVIFHSKIKQTLLPEVLMDIMCYTLWLCMQAQMFCRCIRFSLIGLHCRT